MSPEARASSTVLAKLIAALRADRSTLTTLRDQIVASVKTWGQPPTPEASAYVGVKLHAVYGTIESTMERIARHVDVSVPAEAEWHKALIDQMVLELPGMRPPLFDSVIASDLHKLLSFRHFFRHAYAIELDAEELRRNVAIVERLWPKLDGALAAMELYLEEALATVSLA